jgi:predicted nucleic acid-binding protein
VAAATWIEVEDSPADIALLEELDVGEASAIPLAERLHATLLCDDGAARVIARSRGLAVVGTLGVLLRAKREGHIALIAPVIGTMAELGMFVSDDLRTAVLAAARE